MKTSKKITTPDGLRKRILYVKDKLPAHYTALLIEHNPSFKGNEEKIRKIVALQLVDEDITIALEKFIKALN